MSGPPDDRGGNDDEQGGGPPSHVELPDAVPDHVRERLQRGRTERRATGSDTMEGQL